MLRVEPTPEEIKEYMIEDADVSRLHEEILEIEDYEM